MNTSLIRRAALTGLAGALLAGGALPAGTAAAAGTVPTRTVLVVTHVPAVTGQPVFLRGAVKKTGTGAVPTGTVTFLDGTTAVTTVTLVAGSAVAKTSHGFTAGSHSLTARYSGDATYAASTSNRVVITVGKAKTQAKVTFTKAASAGMYNIVVAENAVHPGRGNPSGAVSVKVDGGTAHTITLNAQARGHITLALAKGTHHVVATYPGDANYTGNTGRLAFTI